MLAYALRSPRHRVCGRLRGGRLSVKGRNMIFKDDDHPGEILIVKYLGA